MAQPPIQRLAEEMLKARGTAHFRARATLMAYIRKLSDEEFKEQIERITDPILLRHLWSIGLSWEQQRIVALRAERLGE